MKNEISPGLKTKNTRKILVAIDFFHFMVEITFRLQEHQSLFLLIGKEFDRSDFFDRTIWFIRSPHLIIDQ